MLNDNNDNLVPFNLGKINATTADKILLLINQQLPPLPARRTNRKNGAQLRANVILTALLMMTKNNNGI